MTRIPQISATPSHFEVLLAKGSNEEVRVICSSPETQDYQYEWPIEPGPRLSTPGGSGQLENGDSIEN